MAKWEAEFNQLMNAQRDEYDLDYGSAMQNAWADYDGNLDENSVKFDSEGLPILSPYSFGVLLHLTTTRTGRAYSYYDRTQQ